MNIKQKALVERAIKIRYNGLIQSLEKTETVVETEFRGLNTHAYIRQPHGDAEDLPPALKRDFIAIKNSVKALEEHLQAENERRHAIRTDAERKRRAVIAELRRERDERIIEVAFEGEEKDVVAQLKTLPTAKQVVGRLGPLKLTAELIEAAGVGEDRPAVLSVE